MFYPAKAKFLKLGLSSDFFSVVASEAVRSATAEGGASVPFAHRKHITYV